MRFRHSPSRSAPFHSRSRTAPIHNHQGRCPFGSAHLDTLRRMDATTLESITAVHGGVLRRHHLIDAGYTPREIARLIEDGVLARVHRDAYRLPDEDEPPVARFHAAVTALRLRDPTRILTGPAALSTLGLPVFSDPRTVHVATDRRGGSSRRSLTTTVTPPPDDQLCRAAGVIVARTARAVLDTARLHSLVAGVVAADVALRRGLTTTEELTRVVETMSRLNGVQRARLCADLASPESESPGESWSAVVLHQHGIPRPCRQQPFGDTRGFIGRSDFWWPDRRVVGEFDGRVKYGRRNPSGRPPEDVLWDEKVREDRLRALDLTVNRWVTADLHRPRAWIERLRGLVA